MPLDGMLMQTKTNGSVYSNLIVGSYLERQLVWFGSLSYDAVNKFFFTCVDYCRM